MKPPSSVHYGAWRPKTVPTSTAVGGEKGATPTGGQSLAFSDASFNAVCLGAIVTKVLIHDQTSELRKHSGDSFPVILRRKTPSATGHVGFREIIKVHSLGCGASPNTIICRPAGAPLPMHPAADPFFTGRGEPAPGEAFGVVEQKVASVLGSLMVEPGKGLGAGVGGDNGHLSRRVWIKAEVLKNDSKNEDATTLPLQLLFFAFLSSAGFIADHLATNNFLLQPPENYSPTLHANCRYYYIKPPGFQYQVEGASPFPIN